MSEYLQRFQERVTTPFEHLTTAQKLTMMMVFVLTVIGTTVVIKWAIQPEYAVLVSNLDPADVQAVISELKNDKVPYKIIQDGTGVMVPRKDVYDFRMKLAAKDLPSGGSVLGYEIFDKKDIGISEFVQHVNYRRALEGELARTIQTLPEVIKARVHIVFPKERLFKEDQKQPTASVVLSLKRGIRLTDEQVNGITLIVARSVEGLETENVTIVDEHGNILSKKRPEDLALGLSEGQLKLQMQVESYYEEKAQSMLDQVLGPGNAIVRVSADLDFRRIEQTKESYDPDNAAILSEEVQSQTAQDTSSGNNSTEHTITNYQLSKSLEHVINDVGSIKKLSVAVLVNGKYVEVLKDGKVEKKYEPRTADELNRLSSLVRNAVGLNESRGDQIDVQNFPFENGKPGFGLEQNQYFTWDRVVMLVQKILMVLLIIGGLLFVRSKLRKAKESLFMLQQPQQPEVNQLPESEETQDETPELEEAEEPTLNLEMAKETPEERARREVEEFVRNNPSTAAQLVKSWIVEEIGG